MNIFLVRVGEGPLPNIPTALCSGISKQEKDFLSKEKKKIEEMFYI